MPEFAGLLLLFFACCATSEAAIKINSEVMTMSNALRTSEPVAFAFRVWRWIGDCNYHRFFGKDGYGSAGPLQRVFLDAVVCSNSWPVLRSLNVVAGHVVHVFETCCVYAMRAGRFNAERRSTSNRQSVQSNTCCLCDVHAWMPGPGGPLCCL